MREKLEKCTECERTLNIGQSSLNEPKNTLAKDELFQNRSHANQKVYILLSDITKVYNWS